MPPTSAACSRTSPASAPRHRRRRRRRPGRRRDRAAGLARPADGGRRSLSGAQGQQELPRAAEQLAEIEDQLQMARRYYNGTVRDFNISIQTLPRRADRRPAAAFSEEPFFEIDDGVGRGASRSAFPEPSHASMKRIACCRCCCCSLAHALGSRPTSASCASSATSHVQRNGDLDRHRDDPRAGRGPPDPARHPARFSDRSITAPTAPASRSASTCSR